MNTGAGKDEESIFRKIPLDFFKQKVFPPLSPQRLASWGRYDFGRPPHCLRDSVRLQKQHRGLENCRLDPWQSGAKSDASIKSPSPIEAGALRPGFFPPCLRMAA